MAVRQERTNWRDAGLSQRHRLWGDACPCVDIDFLVVEYHFGKPCAIVEYKHELALSQTSRHPSYRAIMALGDCAGIPVLACRYSSDFVFWNVTALNDCAKNRIPKNGEHHTARLTEKEWVILLYEMRGIDPPADVLAKLNDSYP